MWPGPDTHEVEALKCCGIKPTLRLRPKLVFTTKIDYVQFECAKCGSEGGLAVCEEDALVMWNRQYEP